MSGSGRKRTTDRHYSAEDQALDQISKEAEERIQARRQARAEAREMRMKEIERQQKEEEDKQKAQSQGTDSVKRNEEMEELMRSLSLTCNYQALSSFSGSRRGSNDSTESDMSSKDSNDPKDQLRKSKIQLRELEDKYKAAMLTNAQLDNIKTSNIFQIELLKEQLEEQEEQMLEDYDFLKRDFDALKLDNEGIRHQMDVKDRLLKIDLCKF
ncbi:LRRF2-like protein [Mya arenaria]|uniref:LRRF2-like protein n=1 Tax=Mya arenaria TaxID=6604 RepID=A0ABY7DCF3_MYAAR|nr:LRRF2-like protein [Mya arenaria]